MAAARDAQACNNKIMSYTTMDDEATYEFDIHGVIVFRNVLPLSTVAHYNRLMDDPGGPSGKPGKDDGVFMGDNCHPDFLALMAHQPTLEILRVMLGAPALVPAVRRGARW